VNDLIQNLTGAEAGSYTATVFLLTMLSNVLFAVGAGFLSRRNDLGWWVYLLGVFAGPLFVALYPGQNDYWLLLGAVPQLLAGVVGLWAFSRYSLRGRFTRRVENAEFSVAAVVLLVILTFVVTILQFGQTITAPSVLFGSLATSAALTPWLNAVFVALATLSFAYLGFGARWAWLTLALSGAGLAALTTAQPALTGADRPLFGLLFGYVLLFVAAVYGFLAWRVPLPAAPVADAADPVPDDAPADDDAAAEDGDIAESDDLAGESTRGDHGLGEPSEQADRAASGNKDS